MKKENGGRNLLNLHQFQQRKGPAKGRPEYKIDQILMLIESWLIES